MSPRVSILMSEYETPREQLEKALQAILAQTYTDFEVVIVNDSGSDQLSSVLSQYSDPRFRLIDNGGNIGFALSLNRGLAASRGQYIVRLDTDDWVEPDHVHRLVDFMDAHPECTVSSTRAVEFGGVSDGRVIGRPGKKDRTNIIKGDTVVHPASCFRRDAVCAIGGYPIIYQRCEDYALWCEMILAGFGMVVLSDITCHYRLDSSVLSKRSFSKRFGMIKAIIHFFPRLKASPLAYGRILRVLGSGVFYSVLLLFEKARHALLREEV